MICTALTLSKMAAAFGPKDASSTLSTPKRPSKVLVIAVGGSNNAKVGGNYRKGMAVFTIAKGGLMYEATLGGQKFSYKAKAAAAE